MRVLLLIPLFLAFVFLWVGVRQLLRDTFGEPNIVTVPVFFVIGALFIASARAVLSPREMEGPSGG